MVFTDRKRDDEGFTLIELLVVIIIIGILAAIAIPVYLNQRQRAVDGAMKSDLRNAASEMELYYTEHQAYPVVPPQVGRDVTIGMDTLTLSSGDVLTAYLPPASGVAAETYCLMVQNPTGSGDFYYDSDAGGLQPKNVGCS
jgi:prepilin-type N-terminal cleavage/methylation domain-containing protein